MASQLEKGIFVDYSNDNWYSDIYYYYTNQQSSLVHYARFNVIKKEAWYYWYDSLINQLL